MFMKEGVSQAKVGAMAQEEMTSWDIQSSTHQAFKEGVTGTFSAEDNLKTLGGRKVTCFHWLNFKSRTLNKIFTQVHIFHSYNLAYGDKKEQMLYNKYLKTVEPYC